MKKFYLFFVSSVLIFNLAATQTINSSRIIPREYLIDKGPIKESNPTTMLKWRNNTPPRQSASLNGKGISTGITGYWDFQTNGGQLEYLEVNPLNPNSIHAIMMVATDSENVSSSRRTAYNYSSDGGETWGTPQFLNYGLYERSGYPSLTLKPNGGSQYVAAVANHAQNPTLSYDLATTLNLQNDEGGIFSEAIYSPTPFDTSNPDWPQIKVMQNGDLIILAGRQSPRAGIYSTTYNSITGFSDWVPLDTMSTGSARTGLAVGSDGRIAAAWFAFADNFADYTIRYSESFDNGLTWGPVNSILKNPDDYFYFGGFDLMYIGTTLYIVSCGGQIVNGDVPYVTSKIRLWDSYSMSLRTVIDSLNFPMLKRNDNTDQTDHTFSFHQPSIGKNAAGDNIFIACSAHLEGVVDSEGFHYSDIIYTNSTDGGFSWGNVRNLTNTNDIDERYVSISNFNPTVNDSDWLYLTYQEDAIPGASENISVGDLRPLSQASLKFLKVNTEQIVNPTERLVAYYPFNGNAGDVSGNGNNSNAYGVTLTDDRFNIAMASYHFNGTNNYIITPDLKSSISGKTVTLSVWFKATSGGVIVSELGQETPNDNWHDSQIEIMDDGEVKISVYIDVYGMMPISIGKVQLGRWNHVVLKYDESVQKLEGYLNGSKSASSLTATRLVPSDYGYKMIYAFGAVDGTNLGNGNWFSGEIDDIRIYNRALNDTEIDSLYHENGWNPGSITGNLWQDDNGDGIKDIAEPFLGNWKVYISGDRTDSTITDASGNYTFFDLQTGNYVISENPLHGWSQTVPNSPTSYTINLQPGENLVDINFGIRPPVVDPSLFTFGGIYNGHTYFVSNTTKTFNEAKTDCETNGGHLVTISSGEENNFVGGLGSSEVAYIGFTDQLTEGDWRWLTGELVSFTGWDWTEPGGGTGENHCVTNYTGLGKWHDVNESYATKYILEIDGLTSLTGSISGLKWRDINGDGVRQSGEPGIANWTINISGLINSSTTTNSNGEYTFSYLPLGTYTISETQQTDWTQTYPSAPGSYDVEITAGANVTDKNFGNKPPAVDPNLFTYAGEFNGSKYYISTNAKYWHDAKSDCEANGGHLVTISSADENNFVSNISPSETYWIGYTDESVEGTWQWVTGEGTIYTNWWWGEPNNGGGIEHYVHTNYGELGRWNDAPNNQNIRYIMEIPLSRSKISGLIWNDLNGDGIKDIDESGLPNWKVYLSGDKTDSTITDVNGNYTFWYLNSGSYVISGENKTDWTQTYPSISGSYNISLAEGQQLTDINFGNHTEINFDLFTFAGEFNGSRYYVSKFGKSWQEAKADCEASGGHLVTIGSAEENNFIANLSPYEQFCIGLTDENNIGNWCWITGEELIYTNWYPGEPNGGGELYGYINYGETGKWNNGTDGGGFRYIMEIPSNKSIVSGIVWNDENNNGIKDGSEGFLESWKIKFSGTANGSTLTDANGNYNLNIFLPGSYTISLELQNNWAQTSPLASSSYTIEIVGGEDTTGFNFGSRYAPANISVSPLSLSATIYSGDTDVQQINISNTGESDLTFNIDLNQIISAITPKTKLRQPSVLHENKIGFYADESRPDTVNNIEELLSKSSQEQRTISSVGNIIRTYLNFPNCNYGMVWLGNKIYVVDRCNSRIQIYDVKTQSVVGGFTIHYNAWGITSDGRYLWIGNNSGNVYGYDLNGNRIGSFSLHTRSPHTLTWDGEYFVATPWWSGNLYRVDYSGDVIETITGLPYWLTGMVWVPQHSSGNLWGTTDGGRVVQLSIVNSGINIIKEFDLGCCGSYSLAHNGQDLWWVNSSWSPTLYQIDDGIQECITVIPSAGTIQPGQAQNIEITFNGFGIDTSTINSNLLVISNDPDDDSITVSTTLNVIGAPNIYVTPSTITFDSTFVGYSKTDTLLVQNTGVQSLIIGNISSGNPSFSTDLSSFTLNPSGKQKLVVRFSPTTSGNITGNITFTSNDPSNGTYLIPVSGKAMHPPVIGVNPQTLSFTLLEGDSTTSSFIINNSGLGELQYDIENEFIFPVPPPVTNYKILSSIKNIKVAEPSRKYENVDDKSLEELTIPTALSSINNLGRRLFSVNGNKIYEIDLNTGNPIRAISLPTVTYWWMESGLAFSGQRLYVSNNYDSKIYIVDPFTGKVIKRYSQPPETIQDLAFVNGKLYALAPNSNTIYEMNPYDGAILRSIVPPVYIGGGMDGGNGRLFVSNYGNAIYELSLVDGSVINSWQPVNYIRSMGFCGDTLYASDQCITAKYNPNTGECYGSQSGLCKNGMLAGGTSVWLSESQITGVIQPGQNQQIDLKINAKELYGGNFNANLVVSSNDPVSPQKNVSASLTVTGIPDIAVMRDSIKFDSTYLNIGKIDSFFVRNTGTAELILNNITTNNSLFTATPSSLTIPVGTKGSIYVIFNPVEVGEFNASLTINSNDPDQPVSTVYLSGIGRLSPPSISGLKTVGVGGNYTTLKEAFDSINVCFISDTLRLKLLDTAYYEQSLLLYPIDNKPSAPPLIIEPQGIGKSTIYFEFTDTMEAPVGIHLINISNVQFNQLRFVLDTLHGWEAAVRMEELCPNISFTNITLDGGNVYNGFETWGYNSSLTLNNDTIQNVGQCLYAAGSTAIDLRNSFLANNADASVWLETENGSINIENNKFDGKGIAATAIGGYASGSFLNINKNDISGFIGGIFMDGFSGIRPDYKTKKNFTETNSATLNHKALREKIQAKINALKSRDRNQVKLTAKQKYIENTKNPDRKNRTVQSTGSAVSICDNKITATIDCGMYISVMDGPLTSLRIENNDVSGIGNWGGIVSEGIEVANDGFVKINDNKVSTNHYGGSGLAFYGLWEPKSIEVKNNFVVGKDTTIFSSNQKNNRSIQGYPVGNEGITLWGNNTWENGSSLNIDSNVVIGYYYGIYPFIYSDLVSIKDNNLKDGGIFIEDHAANHSNIEGNEIIDFSEAGIYTSNFYAFTPGIPNELSIKNNTIVGSDTLGSYVGIMSDGFESYRLLIENNSITGNYFGDGIMLGGVYSPEDYNYNLLSTNRSTNNNLPLKERILQLRSKMKSKDRKEIIAQSKLQHSKGMNTKNIQSQAPLTSSNSYLSISNNLINYAGAGMGPINIGEVQGPFTVNIENNDLRTVDGADCGLYLGPINGPVLDVNIKQNKYTGASGMGGIWVEGAEIYPSGSFIVRDNEINILSGDAGLWLGEIWEPKILEIKNNLVNASESMMMDYKQKISQMVSQINYPIGGDGIAFGGSNETLADSRVLVDSNRVNGFYFGIHPWYISSGQISLSNNTLVDGGIWCEDELRGGSLSINRNQISEFSEAGIWFNGFMVDRAGEGGLNILNNTIIGSDTSGGYVGIYNEYVESNYLKVENNSINGNYQGDGIMLGSFTGTGPIFTGKANVKVSNNYAPASISLKDRVTQKYQKMHQRDLSQLKSETEQRWRDRKIKKSNATNRVKSTNDYTMLSIKNNTINYAGGGMGPMSISEMNGGGAIDIIDNSFLSSEASDVGMYMGWFSGTGRIWIKNNIINNPGHQGIGIDGGEIATGGDFIVRENNVRTNGGWGIWLGECYGPTNFNVSNNSVIAIDPFSLQGKNRKMEPSDLRNYPVGEEGITLYPTSEIDGCVVKYDSNTISGFNWAMHLHGYGPGQMSVCGNIIHDGCLYFCDDNMQHVKVDNNTITDFSEAGIQFFFYPWNEELHSSASVSRNKIIGSDTVGSWAGIYVMDVYAYTLNIDDNNISGNYDGDGITIENFYTPEQWLTSKSNKMQMSLSSPTSRERYNKLKERFKAQKIREKDRDIKKIWAERKASNLTTPKPFSPLSEVSALSIQRNQILNRGFGMGSINIFGSGNVQNIFVNDNLATPTGETDAGIYLGYWEEVKNVDIERNVIKNTLGIGLWIDVIQFHPGGEFKIRSNDIQIYGGTGLWLGEIYEPLKFDIMNNSVKAVVQTMQPLAVYSLQKNSIKSSNTIIGEEGIAVYPFNETSGSSFILSSNLVQNFDVGINLVVSGFEQVILSRNQANNNRIGFQWEGACLNSTISTNIEGNILTKNIETGLSINLNDYFCPMTIDLNSLSENDSVGLFVGGSGTMPIVTNNTLLETNKYSLWNETEKNIAARFNWWGDSTTKRMSTLPYPSNIDKIHDSFDDPTKGFVVYKDWLSNSPGGSSISGLIYNDINGNGIQDSSEVGIIGYAVFIDLNSNDTLELGERYTSTDFYGNYQFSNLGFGTYRIRQVMQGGWVQTTPKPLDIKISIDTAITGVNFGNRAFTGFGYTFVGQSGSNWSNPGNWSGSKVPGPTAFVKVPENVTVFVDSLPFDTIAALEINWRGKLKFDSTVGILKTYLQVHNDGTIEFPESENSGMVCFGDFINHNTIIPGKSRVIFVGDNPKLIHSSTFYNLEILGENTGTAGNLTVNNLITLDKDLEQRQTDTLIILKNRSDALIGDGVIKEGTIIRNIAEGDTSIYRFESKSSSIKFDGTGIYPSKIMVSTLIDSSLTDPDELWETIQSYIDTAKNIVSANCVNKFSKWRFGIPRPRIVNNNPLVNRLYTIEAFGGSNFCSNLSLRYEQTEIPFGVREDSLSLFRSLHTEVEKSITAGWNIISLPVRVRDNQKTSIFGNSNTSAFAYEGRYVNKEFLYPGVGYWIKYNNSENVTISGSPILIDTIEINFVGWNLIGTIYTPVPVNNIISIPPQMTTSGFFDFDGQYRQVDTLKPGRGYWVKVDQPGKLILAEGEILSFGSKINIIPTSELPPPHPDEKNIDNVIPSEFKLNQNYPNPFNPTTVISYSLPVDCRVTLKIYNLLGQEVKTLVNEYQDAGNKSVEWNANSLPSGVYMYRLNAEKYSDVKKLILMK
ncbi:MAG: choice-of-anchor D domain-containing protein [Ignavibacteriales bacterium]|nr:choice-of-anchor D domain-containing protein [Ignavibacteriales bacterium]